MSSRAIIGEPYPRELPARMRRKKVTIARANVTGWSNARTPTQNKLVAHKLAVVFPDDSRLRLESRIGDVRARGPLPNITEDLLHSVTPGGLGMENIVFQHGAFYWHANRSHLPFRFCRQALAPPARIGIGFVIADVTDRLSRINFPDSRLRRSSHELLP